jgi:hypothetical protein
MELVQCYICLKGEVGVELKPRVPNVDGLAQVIWSDETEESEGQARSESSQLQGNCIAVICCVRLDPRSSGYILVSIEETICFDISAKRSTH